ncbi:hypothetical protein D3C86_1823120 [compost metagenome]
MQRSTANIDGSAEQGRPAKERIEQRRLAGPVPSDHGHRFARIDIKVEVADDNGLAVAGA